MDPDEKFILGLMAFAYVWMTRALFPLRVAVLFWIIALLLCGVPAIVKRKNRRRLEEHQHRAALSIVWERETGDPEPRKYHDLHCPVDGRCRKFMHDEAIEFLLGPIPEPQTVLMDYTAVKIMTTCTCHPKNMLSRPCFCQKCQCRGKHHVPRSLSFENDYGKNDSKRFLRQLKQMEYEARHMARVRRIA